MKRTLIAPGVHLSCDPAEKFNRCRISIHFAFPAKRETATAHALLPLVMERGYADCPDMTRLTKKLAKLYGADLTVDASQTADHFRPPSYIWCRKGSSQQRLHTPYISECPRHWKH